MAKIKKECECCSKTFEVYPAAAKRRRTCSRECGYNIQRVENSKEKPCAGCGTLTRNPKYCSNQCQGRTVKDLTYNRDKELFSKGELTSRPRLRIFLEERDGLVCSRCKLSSWMDSTITLWVDHVNGNASDNSPDNLRFMCPNCDSQSDTFGGKNIGNGRRSQGLKPWH